jgi:hypothetical protein
MRPRSERFGAFNGLWLLVGSLAHAVGKTLDLYLPGAGVHSSGVLYTRIVALVAKCNVGTDARRWRPLASTETASL